MVTLETSKDIFFGLEDCDLCNFIELVTKFLPLPPRIIRMKKPNKEILNYTPTKTMPFLKSGDDFITGALPIVKYLIKSAKDDSDGVLLDNRKILLGKNLKEEAAIDTWTNYIFFDMAVNDLMEVLIPINERLKLNTFLTSNKIQLADLMLVSVLFRSFNDVFTKDKIEKIPNVTRLFKFVSHMKRFEEIFGVYVPCKEVKTPEPFVEKNDKEKGEKKEKNKNKENKGEHHDEKKENKKHKEKKENKEKTEEKK